MTLDNGHWVEPACALPSFGRVHPMAIIQDMFACEREENDSYSVVAHQMKKRIKKQRVNPCILYLYFIVPHCHPTPPSQKLLSYHEPRATQNTLISL